MTIPNAVVPRINYPGTGAQTSFPYPWLVLDPGDLAVYQNGVLKTLGVHYTLSSVGTPTGGNVVFALAPASGDSLVFIRATQATQQTVLADTGPAAMTAIERGLDRATMLIQELNAKIARAALLSIFSATENPTMADPHALWPVRWNNGATGLEPFDPTTILPSSATLPLALSNGGTGATTALAARAALGVDGQQRKVLTNLSGVTLAAGDVVALDTTNDSAVVLGDTVSSKAQFVVALESIAHTATGEFCLSGICAVNVTGTITRGRYLRKSATSKVAEDSGTLHGAATDPPQGTFALALTGGTTSITARLFGLTYQGSTAPTIIGLPRLFGALGGNAVASPTTQYDLFATAAIVRDPTGGGIVVLPAVANRTVDISVAGPVAGGRDQVAAFGANTWIYLYLIAKTDGTYHVTASINPPATGPVLPSGYTLWAAACALRIDNSSQLMRSRIRGTWSAYDAQQVGLSSGVATVETAVNLSTLVPPTALNIRLHASAVPSVGGVSPLNNPRLRVTTGLDFYRNENNSGNASGSALNLDLTVPNVGQQVFYLWQDAPSAANGLYLSVSGYENP